MDGNPWIKIMYPISSIPLLLAWSQLVVVKLRFFVHLILKDENILFNSTKEKHVSKS